MRSNWDISNDQQLISYEWKLESNWNKIAVKASTEGTALIPGSEEEFITEHYWGYAAAGSTKTNEYEVTHPRWQVYKVLDHDIQTDFGANYGKRFSFLQSVQPASVMLAEGSKITVEQKTTIRTN